MHNGSCKSKSSYQVDTLIKAGSEGGGGLVTTILLYDLLVPLVRGPLRELLTATSVTGLSADWLAVSLSDTCETNALVTGASGLIGYKYMLG